MKIKKNIKNNETLFALIIILLATIFICIPLFNKHADMTYDDGIQHICRLIGTYKGFFNGNTKIFTNDCNNFGYSWNLFYSPITSYIPVLFKVLGVSFATCIKLFMFVAVYLSGYFMYVFLKKVTNNNYTAIISAIMYIYVPYRFTDMYIRNAFAELTSFTFLPLIFLGLYELFNEKDKLKIYVPLVLGTCGLILTHTVITLYTAIFAFIYFIVNIIKKYNEVSNIKEKTKKNNEIKRIIRITIISGILILLITAFYLAPLLQMKKSAEYEVFKPGRMERIEVLISYKLDFFRLFITLSNNYMICNIGLVVIIGLALTPIAIKKIKNEKYYNLYLFALIAGTISAIMTLKQFPFEHLPRILKMLQFSFRMLEFVGFFYAIVAAINITCVLRKIQRREVVIILIVMSLLMLPYFNRVRTLENYDESILINVVPVTSQTGRVHAGLASFEYLPCKAFENRSYIETRTQDVITINGNCEIKGQNKNDKELYFTVSNAEEGTQLELPYIYYPGYSVYITNNGKTEKIKTFETDKGFVGINLKEMEEAKVEVKYTGTTLMNITEAISVITIFIFLFYVLYIKIKKDRT